MNSIESKSCSSDTQDTKQNTEQNVQKLSHMIIGTNDLSEKMTGLVRRRVYFLINCSSKDSTLGPAQGFKVLRIVSDPQDDHYSADILSDQDVTEILKMFESVNERKKIMIHSDVGSRSKIMYCLIAMKVLGFSLKQLIDIFEQRDKILSEPETPDMLDLENFRRLTPEELDILQNIELQIFGSSSTNVESTSVAVVEDLAHDPITVPVQSNVQTNPIMTFIDSSALNEELMMKMYQEDLQRMEDESLLDALAAETAAEIVAKEIADKEATTANQTDDVRAPIQPQTMVLADTFDVIPRHNHAHAQRIWPPELERSSGSATSTDDSRLSLQMMNHEPVPYTNRNAAQRSRFDIHAPQRTEKRPEAKIVESHMFEDYMATFGNNGSSQGTQVLHVQKKPSNGQAKVQVVQLPTHSRISGGSGASASPGFAPFSGPGYVSGIAPRPDAVRTDPRARAREQVNSNANTQNPFNITNTKDNEYKRIMSMMAGRVNPDLVRDMLNAGMHESDIIDALTVGV